MSPAVRQLTRTFGAHSTASVCVRLTSPAFAAPYAALFGDGRMPLTLPMLTMHPPLSCACITALTRCAKTSGAMRFSVMIDVVNFGDAVDESAGGAPPALLTST